MCADFRRPDTGIFTAEGNVAGTRAAALTQKRQREQEEFEERKRQLQQSNQHVDSIHSKFEIQRTITESQFVQQTVGLVSVDEYRAISQQQQQRGNAAGEMKHTVKVESEEERLAREKAEKKESKRKLKEKRKQRAVLSFADEEEEEHEEEGIASKPLLTKDPTVNTSFLPDKRREMEQQLERERLEREWKERQESMKLEKLEITYSYWDGSGHRRTVVCSKGDSIGAFLEKCRQDLCREFRELNSVAADALLYVKEDLIIPQDLTFYDLIATQARGKSGPLFQFDVKEDLRLGPIDSRVETEESHPGKVVERRWYERNKHIFPASRWETYDPSKEYGKYKIGDRVKDHSTIF